MKITLNAFSFARMRLKEMGIPCVNVEQEVDEGISAQALITELGLSDRYVEAVFINGTIMPKETHLKEGDRIALLPPGTPGSYRLILGIKAAGASSDSQTEQAT